MKNFHIKNMCMFYKRLSFWQVLVQKVAFISTFLYFISFHFISKMLSTQIYSYKLPVLSNIFCIVKCKRPKYVLTLFRMGRRGGGGGGGGGKKALPIRFSTVTSTNVGVSPQSILTLSYNPLATLV